MGGRGSSSMSGGKTARNRIGSSAAMSAKDWNELSAVASANNIPLDDSFSKIEFESAKLALAGVIDIADEFPFLDRGMLTLYGAGGAGGRAMASASLNGKIFVNPSYFSDANSLEGIYAHSVKTGFHPEGSTARSITSHEAGHILEAHLVRLEYGYTNDAVAAWNKCKVATRIVGQASRNLKKTPEGKGTRIADQIKSVSGYATKNRSETLAECVADYISNGSNAKPLSKEVWGILKQKLG